MPATSYIMDGTVFDSAGTAKNAASVRIYNVTTGDNLQTVTNSSGQFAIDLANFTTAVTNGDVLIVSSYINKYSVDYRTTVNTANIGESKDLYLMEGDSNIVQTPSGTKATGQVCLLSYQVSNTDSSARYLELFEVYTGNKIMTIYVGATASVTCYFGSFGVSFRGGIAKVPSANNKLIPALVVY